MTLSDVKWPSTFADADHTIHIPPIFCVPLHCTTEYDLQICLKPFPQTQHLRLLPGPLAHLRQSCKTWISHYCSSQEAFAVITWKPGKCNWQWRQLGYYMEKNLYWLVVLVVLLAFFTPSGSWRSGTEFYPWTIIWDFCLGPKISQNSYLTLLLRSVLLTTIR